MKYDCLIVGSGTAGVYLANLLSNRNYKVLVIEKDKEEDISKRLDILHFGYDGYNKFGIPAPDEKSDEFEHHFLYSYSSSALDTFKKKNYNNIYAIHLPLMNKRMRDMACEVGTEFSYETSFKEIVYDDKNEIKGVIAIKDNKEFEIDANLVVDASGIPSVVRRNLKSPFMENFEIGPKDKFYVILKYVKYKDPKNETVDCQSWPYFKCWIGPSTKGGGIIGTGASTSFDFCKKMQAKYESKLPRPEYDIDHYEYGATPYTRSPFSYVAPHFLCIGDSACMTNPLSGEGLTYHFGFIKDSIDIIDNALKKGTTIENLWPINVNYNRGFYKDPAWTRSLLACFMKMSEKENEALYKHSIIFKNDEDPEPNMVKELLKALFKGEMSLGTIINLVSSLGKANKLKAHYENYPENPSDYESWAKKAQILWDKAGKITDVDKDE